MINRILEFQFANAFSFLLATAILIGFASSRSSRFQTLS
jgi:hypothetical protein